jgi:hypothetical protein
MTTPLRTRHRLTYVLAALSAGALIAAAVPQRARAADSRAQAAPQAGAAADHWCSTIPPGFGHPPVNLTVPALQVLQRSVEPVPATDGLIHLAYAALALNTLAQPVQIVSVVPVDPLAGFSPTGRNFIRTRRAATLPARSSWPSHRRTPPCRPTPRCRNPCLASRRACRPGTWG